MTNVYIVVYYTDLVINILNNIISQSRNMHVTSPYCIFQKSEKIHKYPKLCCTNV